MNYTPFLSLYLSGNSLVPLLILKCSFFIPVILPFYLIYLAYIYFDRHRAVLGGRKSKWVRSWWIFKGYASVWLRSVILLSLTSWSHVFLFRVPVVES